ncbi:transmembrane protein 138-like [Watersipora subatra]|uniref:transmembrane protein 138-like n=1 Tax=Watersipora subatra TaxID=2589382 RepID=UPI00355BBEE6
MENDRFKIILMLQYFLLCVDLFMNSFSELIRSANLIMLVLFVVQDICIIFAIIVLFLTFFNTYIFRAGLVVILVKKFKTTIVISFLYLAFCIALHVHGMQLRWNEPTIHVTASSFWVLFGIQRVSAVFYYYFYKRTCIVLGDPRFYEYSKWIHNEFIKRR